MGESVAGRRVVVSLWHIVAVLVMLWMVVEVVEVVVVEDVGGSHCGRVVSRCGCVVSHCGHVVSRGGRVVMRQGRGGQWMGWRQWMVV